MGPTQKLRLALLLVALSAPPAQAGCEGRRVFRVEGVDRELCFVQGSEAWVSANCTKATGSAACQALTLLKSAPAVGTLSAQERNGGKNPGSVLCTKLRGTVLFAKLANGSQLSFCETSDHSLIDCNSIEQAWNARRK